MTVKSLMIMVLLETKAVRNGVITRLPKTTWNVVVVDGMLIGLFPRQRVMTMLPNRTIFCRCVRPSGNYLACPFPSKVVLECPADCFRMGKGRSSGYQHGQCRHVVYHHGRNGGWEI